jgi:hypothetical protein
MSYQAEQEFLDHLHTVETTKAEAISALMSVYCLDSYHAEIEVDKWHRAQLETCHA